MNILFINDILLIIPLFYQEAAPLAIFGGSGDGRF
jgi:hypothetical protein